ncbi:MAG: 3-oxoacyl-[acyl-carrier-protein] reductase [Deltaproteobacteria bacterium]|jgi:3-oxoacyl-[acyl-carrier protein] reductase|nr:3-oxoacyl-[acyl-carrier-protein] reductase [Deltaproteobacteria bacterium]
MTISKVILVTGGTRGIGLAIAKRLASKTVALVVTHVNPKAPALDQVAEELTPLCGAFEIQCWSVADPALASQKVSEIAERYGRLDVLVNNAGVTKDSFSVRMSFEDFKSVVDLNLVGTFACSKAAAKIMMRQRSGRIINISSVVAFSGNPGQANYVAAKAGIVGITKSMALELASRKVTVNAVAPGYIETDMTAALDEKAAGAILSKIPMQRVGRPQDVAEAAAFLASDEASYITGQVIHVNGGLYM